MLTLSPEAKEARRKYLAAWRKRNPDKVREYTKNFWERKAQEAGNRGEKNDAK